LKQFELLDRRVCSFKLRLITQQTW